MGGRLLTLALTGVLAGSVASPASAQFYKDKTLSLLINYGIGGNADTEARVYQRYLPKYIAGNPSVIIQNAPGAGGLKAMNMLGLDIGSRADGLTAGYFTISATSIMVGDPALKVSLDDFAIVSGARGWNVVYARKDMPPGLTKPADIARATKVFIGGYSRASSHDTRLRLAMEVFGVPYTAVVGFPATADVNKAMLQNEVNLSGSSLPGYQTQVLPNIIKPGIGLVLFHYPIIGSDGRPTGNPSLEAQGIRTLDKVYEEAFGKPPSGPKFEALLLMNDIGTQLQRAILLPKNTPEEAVRALREALRGVANDEGFRADYEKVTGEKPDIVFASELEPLFERLRKMDPKINQVLKDSIDGK
jgi:tripartite-type tricarboxylate transporter receptor subunit TctC